MATGALVTKHRAAAAAAAVASLMAACAGHRPMPPPSADRQESEFRNAVRTLSSDDFEGRRPGTAGEEKTVGFLVQQFQKMGLKPANGTSFSQPVPLVEITPLAGAELSFSAGGATKSLEFGKDMVLNSPRESAEASLRGSEVVFVGYGIVASEYGWDDYRDADVHGKTALVMLGDPGYGTKDPKVFHGSATTRYGQSTYKAQEALRHGAAAVLFIHDAGLAGYPWAVVVNDRSGPQLALAGGDTGSGRPAIEGWLSLGAARALFKQAGRDFDALTAAAAKPGFKAVGLGMAADASVHSSVRRFMSSNVVAVLPGSGHRRECVIYGAHWDHLGRQSTAGGSAVFSGAVDNAAGVAGLLSLAQSWSRTRPAPDRSILFIAFTGGESGLSGSSYYVDHPLYPLRDTVAMLDLDMPHIGGPTRDVMVFGLGNSELDDTAAEVVALQGRELKPDSNPEQGIYYRSDADSFAMAGVPALYAEAGLDDSARGPAWGREQRSDYFAHRYHQPSDQYAAGWDLRGTLEDLSLYYEVGSRLARSRRFPRFYPNSEFRVPRTP